MDLPEGSYHAHEGDAHPPPLDSRGYQEAIRAHLTEFEASTQAHTHAHVNGLNDMLASTHLPATTAPSTTKKKKKGKLEKDRIWNTTTNEERERIKDFWLNLGEEERKSLVRVEKEAVLKKMKEQQKHSCSCSVCGRKRTAIEEELEVLYDAYYEELEQYANQQRDQQQHQRLHPEEAAAAASDHIRRLRPHHGKITEMIGSDDEDSYDDDGLDSEDLDSERSYDDELSGDEYSDAYEEDRAPTEFFKFGNSLTVKGGVLTVADDLLKNDGKKFIEMMEQLAERRMQREEEAALEAQEYDDEDDDEYDDDIDSEDYDDEEEEQDALTEEQRMAEGRRMFQIFAARMFEQRVLTAYREKVAQERQAKLLEELELEDSREKEREAKRQKDAAKKKEKKRLQQQKKEEERAKKEAERLAEEAALKAEEARKQEEARKRKEEQRLKKEAEKRALEVERLKKEEEKKKRLAEEKAREQKKQEQLAKEKKAKEDAAKREREAKEAAAREAKAQKEHAKQQQQRQAAQAPAPPQQPLPPVQRKVSPPSKQLSPHVSQASPAIPKTHTPQPQAVPARRSQDYSRPVASQQQPQSHPSAARIIPMPSVQQQQQHQQAQHHQQSGGHPQQQNQRTMTSSISPQQYVAPAAGFPRSVGHPPSLPVPLPPPGIGGVQGQPLQQAHDPFGFNDPRSMQQPPQQQLLNGRPGSGTLPAPHLFSGTAPAGLMQGGIHAMRLAPGTTPQQQQQPPMNSMAAQQRFAPQQGSGFFGLGANTGAPSREDALEHDYRFDNSSSSSAPLGAIGRPSGLPPMRHQPPQRQQPPMQPQQQSSVQQQQPQPPLNAAPGSRPAPIQRPGSVTQPRNNQFGSVRGGVDSLNDVMGSRALLEDDDPIVGLASPSMSFLGSSVSSGGRQTSWGGYDVHGMQQQQQPSHQQQSQGFFHGGASGNSNTWSLSGALATGGPEDSYVPSEKVIRSCCKQAYQRLRQLGNHSLDGFMPLRDVAAQYRVLFSEHEVDESDLLSACGASPSNDNGRGLFLVKHSPAGYLLRYQDEPDGASPFSGSLGSGLGHSLNSLGGEQQKMADRWSVSGLGGNALNGSGDLTSPPLMHAPAKQW
ncbi:salt tolerance down-regulator-domain-containing protein [Protomyces lactucae-debilis]|uniref:Stress response protein NST1 n=1 Tax=Protomyces lactucae-debilis TaxID=2754530 RepID=A0A1Y2FV96_PROLT|nr:salt tolerance down-regulator-domain-containing protein [Protomyces lactucae-debilis]ORY87943.1 salt tolerance down-regulator-domain-containing protein [Protomyces lactucae-debilis]